MRLCVYTHKCQSTVYISASLLPLSLLSAYIVESFVTSVALISPVGSLQPGSEKLKKKKGEKGVPCYRDLGTKYIATNPPASKHRDSLIFCFFTFNNPFSLDSRVENLSLDKFNRWLLFNYDSRILIQTGPLIVWHESRSWELRGTDRKVVKEDGKEDPECLVCMEGRKASWINNRQIGQIAASPRTRRGERKKNRKVKKEGKQYGLKGGWSF